MSNTSTNDNLLEEKLQNAGVETFGAELLAEMRGKIEHTACICSDDGAMPNQSPILESLGLSATEVTQQQQLDSSINYTNTFGLS